MREDEEFGLPAPRPAEVANAAATAMVSRETHADMARFAMARRFPRDVTRARAAIQNAFTRARLAELAVYQYAKGGTAVSGPSIRAAEAIAQGWGNMDFGFRILSQTIGADGVAMSEVQAFAIDYESNLSRGLTFPVRHWLVTRQGGRPLRDDREVYELIANMAARRTRACILAVVPGDIVDDAMDQAEVTLKAKADTSAEAMQKMLGLFAQFAVTREQIEKRIQRTLDAITPAHVVSLRKIYVSLRDGMSRPAQWFESEEGAEAGEAPASGLATVKSALHRRAKRSEEPMDEPKFDTAATLKAIREAQTVDELEVLADRLRSMSADDQAMLGEALAFRQGELTGNSDE